MITEVGSKRSFACFAKANITKSSVFLFGILAINRTFAPVRAEVVFTGDTASIITRDAVGIEAEAVKFPVSAVTQVRLHQESPAARKVVAATAAGLLGAVIAIVITFLSKQSDANASPVIPGLIGFLPLFILTYAICSMTKLLRPAYRITFERRDAPPVSVSLTPDVLPQAKEVLEHQHLKVTSCPYLGEAPGS